MVSREPKQVSSGPPCHSCPSPFSGERIFTLFWWEFCSPFFTLFWWETLFTLFLGRICFHIFLGTTFVHPFLVRTFYQPFLVHSFLVRTFCLSSLSLFWWENLPFHPLSFSGGNFFSPFLVRILFTLFWWEHLPHHPTLFWWEMFVHPFLVRTSFFSTLILFWWELLLYDEYGDDLSTSQLFICCQIECLGLERLAKIRVQMDICYGHQNYTFLRIFGTLSNKTADGYMILLRHQNYTETHYWPCRMPHPILNKKYAQTFPNIRLLQNLKERCEKMKQLLTQLYKNESNILEADIYVSMTRQVHVSGNYKNECLS